MQMKVAIAMSGGIDSTVTALLLMEQGHEVTGITANMKTGIPPEKVNPFISDKNIEDARAIAEKFSFPHHVLDISEDFYHQVISPFCSEYLKGRTPNPCINCNPSIKFKSLIEHALHLGCDMLATGHYAGISKTDKNRYYITRGKDPVKDQSYFLYRLSQNFLSKTLFPLGDYMKTEIRDIARKYELPIAEGPESQEICFIPDEDYARFITTMTGQTPPPGNIVNSKGIVLGRHKGIHRYTIGQRRGLGVSADAPLYVIRIDADSNSIIAGFREELNVNYCTAVNIHHMKELSLDGLKVLTKTRSTQSPVPALLEETGTAVKVTFEEEQQGISPGQAAVFYSNEGHLLGGGTIDQSG